MAGGQRGRSGAMVAVRCRFTRPRASATIPEGRRYPLRTLFLRLGICATNSRARMRFRYRNFLKRLLQRKNGRQISIAGSLDGRRTETISAPPGSPMPRQPESGSWCGRLPRVSGLRRFSQEHQQRSIKIGVDRGNEPFSTAATLVPVQRPAATVSERQDLQSLCLQLCNVAWLLVRGDDQDRLG